MSAGRFRAQGYSRNRDGGVKCIVACNGVSCRSRGTEITHARPSSGKRCQRRTSSCRGICLSLWEKHWGLCRCAFDSGLCQNTTPCRLYRLIISTPVLQILRRSLKAKIKEHNLNRVVVASCTPRTHEPLFQETIRQAGLNPHLFEMANIRDQCSWVHMFEPEAATAKSRDLMRMAVAKVSLDRAT